MNPYPEYKETNLPWLPRIPKHWEVRKIKYILSERREVSNTGTEQLLCLSQYSGITPKNTLVGRFSESLIGYRIVKRNDIVMNIMLAWNGSTAMSAYEGVVSPAYAVFYSKGNANPRFLHYLFKIQQVMQYFKAHSSGVIESRLRLYPDEFAKLSAILPSPAEQAQIVRYLDAMTAKINRLIRAKKKAIALLQEQKQAIINQAVTKGLNPNAEMKDSGIDWIGRVPKHWEIVPIKYCSEILPGFAFDSQKFVSHGKYFLLRGINVGIGKISHDNAVFWNDNIDESVNAFQLKKNDIVLGLDRPWIKNGLRIAKIEECDIPLLLVQRVCRIRAKESMENDFLLVAIQAVLREALETQTTGISVPHISTNQVGNVKIPFPPLEEQREILEDLLSRANTINKSITKILTEIDIVYELKNAYISQVVMGAVDVRSIVIEDFSHEDVDDDFDFSNETENVEECEEYR